MRNIVDIYTEDAGIATTSANTTGMGNPMPPTGDTPGSEPLIPNRKKKKVKHSEEPTIKEGILAGMDNTLQAGDDAIEFIEWYIGEYANVDSNIDANKAKEAMLSAVSFEGKNTVVINAEIAEKTFVKHFDPDRLYIKSSLPPKNIKTIKVIKCKWGYAINSFIDDLSSFNIEVYSDNGKTYSYLDAAFKIATTGTTYKFGNIKCGKFKMTAQKVKTLEIGKLCDILEVDLEQCYELENFKGDFGMPTEMRLSRAFVKKQMVKLGIMNDDTKFYMYN